MPLQQHPPREGIRLPGARIALVANATALECFELGGANRTAIIRKIHIMNNNPVGVNVRFGTGVAVFTQGDLPAYFVVAGFDRIITEEEIPCWESGTDISAISDIAAAAPDDVQVMVECEVFQGN